MAAQRGIAETKHEILSLKSEKMRARRADGSRLAIRRLPTAGVRVNGSPAIGELFFCESSDDMM